MICAALLHDVVEDTETTLEEIAKELGPEVALLVEELTKMAEERFPDMHRTDRKSYEAARLYFVSDEAHTIKVADLIDNTKTIVVHDPKFAVTYLAEKDQLLYHSLTGADPLLLHLAKQQLDAAFIALNLERDNGYG